ncbi:MAG: ABC transporter permease subunit [Planctomycetes bacterium]|nr:ABC transporter permease subunit [Planctomycetota bacterium]
MRNVHSIFLREIRAYFFSPIAYIVISVFLVASGFFFAGNLQFWQEASLKGSLDSIQFFLLLLTPVITMRLLSEEAKTGTMETLMTSPVTDFDVVFGKFLAALGLYMVMILPTWIFVLFLSIFGNPDFGPIISSYIGLTLMGGLFVSIGILVSSLTRNQIVAAVIGLISLILLWVMGFLSEYGDSWYYQCLKYIGTFDHWKSFTKGIVDTRDVIYYLSFTALMLFITVRVVESRKWR